jgi:hypothetical protein
MPRRYTIVTNVTHVGGAPPFRAPGYRLALCRVAPTTDSPPAPSASPATSSRSRDGAEPVRGRFSPAGAAVPAAVAEPVPAPAEAAELAGDAGVAGAEAADRKVAPGFGAGFRAAGPGAGAVAASSPTAAVGLGVVLGLATVVAAGAPATRNVPNAGQRASRPRPEQDFPRKPGVSTRAVIDVGPNVGITLTRNWPRLR